MHKCISHVWPSSELKLLKCYSKDNLWINLVYNLRRWSSPHLGRLACSGHRTWSEQFSVRFPAGYGEKPEGHWRVAVRSPTRLVRGFVGEVNVHRPTSGLFMLFLQTRSDKEESFGKSGIDFSNLKISAKLSVRYAVIAGFVWSQFFPDF